MGKLDSLDERMLKLLTTKSTLEWLKNENAGLKKAAFDNYFHVLVKIWLKLLGFVCLGALITIPVGFILAGTPITFNLINSALNTISINDSIKTIIGPSIAINGLFITFMPVICFFFLSQLKEVEKESKSKTEEIKREIAYEEEEWAEVEVRVKYERAFFHNLRCGVLNYLQTFVTAGLFCLIFLIAAFVMLAPAIFMVVDIILLLLLFTGVSPVVMVALNESKLRPVTIFLKAGPKEIITDL